MSFFTIYNEMENEVMKAEIYLPPDLGSCLTDLSNRFFGFSTNPITSPTSEYMIGIVEK